MYSAPCTYCTWHPGTRSGGGGVLRSRRTVPFPYMKRGNIQLGPIHPFQTHPPSHEAARRCNSDYSHCVLVCSVHFPKYKPSLSPSSPFRIRCGARTELDPEFLVSSRPTRCPGPCTAWLALAWLGSVIHPGQINPNQTSPAAAGQDQRSHAGLALTAPCVDLDRAAVKQGRSVCWRTSWRTFFRSFRDVL